MSRPLAIRTQLSSIDIISLYLRFNLQGLPLIPRTSSYARRDNFNFLETLGQVVVLLLNAYFYMSSCFADVTSATMTAAVHLQPVQISSMSHRAYVLVTLDNDCAVVYCVGRREVASRWLHYEINKFLWVL